MPGPHPGSEGLGRGPGTSFLNKKHPCWFWLEDAAQWLKGLLGQKTGCVWVS